jgi:hypothetical protein
MASADFYGAIFNSFAISPKVSGSDDGQERAAIKLLRMIERFFIGINELSDDVVPRQREKFVHRAYAVGFARRSIQSLCGLRVQHNPAPYLLRFQHHSILYSNAIDKKWISGSV